MKFYFYTILFLAAHLPLTAQWAVFTPDIPDTVGAAHVQTVSDDVAWALAMQFEVFETGFEFPGLERAYFFRTTDGGTTWTNGLVPMGDVPFLSCVYAFDANNAWVAGLDFAQGGSHLLHTTDGGANWTETMGIPFTDFVSWPNIIHFQDAENGIIIGDPAPSADTPDYHFEIYRSTDGGQQWARVPAANIPAPMVEEYGVAGCFSTIGDNIWFGTSSGRILRSADGGSNWQSAATGLDFVNFVSFSDNLTGIAATPPYAIVLTEDGGQTWADITPDGNFTFFVSAAMIPESGYILAVTADNFISGPFTTLISPDKGATWMEIGSGENAGYAHFISPSAGFAGEWQPADHKMRLYTYTGSPLSGLLEGKQLEVDVQVFPNPASDLVRFAVKDTPAADYVLLMHDFQGRLLSQQSFPIAGNWSTDVPIAHLPPGTYTLTLSGQQGAVSRAVVKY